MRTKALTASEANAKLIELGFNKGANTIQDNEYTLPFGKTTFTYTNPHPNMFGPEHLFWEMVGVRFSIVIDEDYMGNSNVRLVRFNGSCGTTVVNYNKLNAAGKKAFMEMAENAVVVEYPEPQRVRDGFRDATYKDENGVVHCAFYDRDGKYCTFDDRKNYLEFYPGEHYEYNATPIVKR